MASINSFINKIKTAAYGKDVRSALSDGLEAVNKEAEASIIKSKETVNRQSILENKYNEQISKATDITEIKDAHVSGTTGKTFQTIGLRADDIEKQLVNVGINALSEGAKPDGTTENETVLNSILSYLDSDGTILFPSGSFVLNGNFTSPFQVVIKGSGMVNTQLVGNFTFDENFIFEDIALNQYDVSLGRIKKYVDFNTRDQQDFDSHDRLIGQWNATDVSHYFESKSSGRNRHYVMAVEMKADGAESGERYGHKVAIYGAAETGKTGDADIWALNTVTEVSEGLPSTTTVNAQGYELDMNNNQGDYYSTWDWDRGNIVALNITSGGTYAITAGLRIGSVGIASLPHYTMVLEGAKKSLALILSQYERGFDFRQALISSGVAMHLADNQSIAVECADGVTREILKTVNGDTFITSAGSSTAIRSSSRADVLANFRDTGEIYLGDITFLKLGTQKPPSPVGGHMYYDGQKSLFRFYGENKFIDISEPVVTAGPPNRAPKAIKEIWIDSDTNKVYLAKGTSGGTDWILLN